MPKRKKLQPKKREPLVAAPVQQKSWDIRLVGPAETAYERFFDLAQQSIASGNVNSTHVTNLAMIDEVLDKIIPKNPFDRAHALTDNLSGIFRYRKGRIRVCWMGTSASRQVLVMFISETLRKEGDANDPYNVLGQMVFNGQFDELADFLGIKRPGGGTPRRIATQ